MDITKFRKTNMMEVCMASKAELEALRWFFRKVNDVVSDSNYDDGEYTPRIIRAIIKNKQVQENRLNNGLNIEE
jgi:hypothetical protein